MRHWIFLSGTTFFWLKKMFFVFLNFFFFELKIRFVFILLHRLPRRQQTGGGSWDG